MISKSFLTCKRSEFGEKAIWRSMVVAQLLVLALPWHLVPPNAKCPTAVPTSAVTWIGNLRSKSNGYRRIYLVRHKII